LKKPLIRQIVISTLYYAIGFFITWLVYKLSGTPYAHGPNLFHLVGLLVILGGIVWLIKAIVSLFTKNRQLGTLLIHTLVLGGIVLSFILEDSKESDIDISVPESIITISNDTSTRSATIVNGNGDTLYFKKGDSVRIDKVGDDTSRQK
jgi:hypothetical protein